MKKLLFAANNLDIGGIERALITLINELSKNPNYEITLVLDKKEGLFINDINDNIKVIEYNSYKSNNIILRKTVNLFKRIIFTLKHKNKYDFSASYATYSIMCSFVARTASKNSNLWGHADYMELYNNDKNKVINFFSSLECEKFKRIIFIELIELKIDKISIFRIINAKKAIKIINSLPISEAIIYEEKKFNKIPKKNIF